MRRASLGVAALLLLAGCSAVQPIATPVPLQPAQCMDQSEEQGPFDSWLENTDSTIATGARLKADGGIYLVAKLTDQQIVVWWEREDNQVGAEGVHAVDAPTDRVSWLGLGPVTDASPGYQTARLCVTGAVVSTAPLQASVHMTITGAGPVLVRWTDASGGGEQEVTPSWQKDVQTTSGSTFEVTVLAGDTPGNIGCQLLIRDEVVASQDSDNGSVTCSAKVP